MHCNGSVTTHVSSSDNLICYVSNSGGQNYDHLMGLIPYDLISFLKIITSALESELRSIYLLVELRK